MGATRLHNFFINGGRGDNILMNSISHDLTNSILATAFHEYPISVDNNSILQEIMVEEMSCMGLIRPACNLHRIKRFHL